MARARTNESLAKLNRRIDRMSAAAQKDVKADLDKGAERVATLAKSLAPVDDGDLRDSIDVVPGDHRLAVKIVAGDDKTFYAPFVEHGADGRPASPFFFPAYRALKRSITTRVNKTMREAAKRDAGV